MWAVGMANLPLGMSSNCTDISISSILTCPVVILDLIRPLIIFATGTSAYHCLINPEECLRKEVKDMFAEIRNDLNEVEAEIQNDLKEIEADIEEIKSDAREFRTVTEELKSEIWC